MTRTNAERQRAYRERQKRQKRNTETLQWKQFANLIISHAALRYRGGKFRLADWIISHFPAHSCYVEPYGGAASVLLRKQPATHEVYNDISSDLVNFFHCLREYPESLIRAINLTPYSREEWELAFEPTIDPLERARRFYVRCYQSFGSEARTNPGWRYQRTSGRASAVRDYHNTVHLWDVAARLLSVQIEHDDALKVIERYDTPETLFYVDPPYVHSERSRKDDYAEEMDDAAHEALATCLRGVQGFVVLSGYPSALYEDLYQGWDYVTTGEIDMQANERIECLWLSPGLYDRVKLPLFQTSMSEE